MEDYDPQNLEESVFERRKLIPQKLEDYGFEKVENDWVLSRTFLDGAFRADLSVSEHGELSGKVIETDFEEEYLPLRVSMQTGETVAKVREAYLDLLHEIAMECTTSALFHSDQANRLTAWVEKTYEEEPDCPFRHNEGMVFRNKDTGKWYGLVMEVPYCKVNPRSRKEDQVEILNVKTDSRITQNLLKQKGIFRAWHMNKTGWVSIVLNDTVDDDAIEKMITVSRAFTTIGTALKKTVLSDHDFVVPANPKYYDVVGELEHTDEILWDRKADMHEGDHVYIYMTAPLFAIYFRLVVIDEHVTDSRWPGVDLIRLKLEKSYPRHLLERRFLKSHGLTNVRSARRMPVELVTAIDELSHVKEER